jgi:hypothetical protein
MSAVTGDRSDRSASVILGGMPQALKPVHHVATRAMSQLKRTFGAGASLCGAPLRAALARRPRAPHPLRASNMTERHP